MAFKIDVDTSKLADVPKLVRELEKSIKVLGKAAGLSEKQIGSLANSLKRNLESTIKSTTKETVKQVNQLVKQAEAQKKAAAAAEKHAQKQSEAKAKIDRTTSSNRQLEVQLRALTAQQSSLSNGVEASYKEMIGLVKVQDQAAAKAKQLGLAGAAVDAYIQGQTNKYQKLTAEIKKQQAAISALNAATSTHVPIVYRFNDAATKAEKSTRGLSTVMRQLAPAVGALGVFAVIAQGIRAFVQTADQMTLLNNRISLLSDGTADLNSEFDNLFRIANESRTGISEVGTLFSRLTPVVANLGGTTKEAAGITESFSKLLLISGTGAREAASALIQFSQALGKGKLDGDEFRTIAEATPEVLRVLEDALGKTRGELFKMSRQGELTADILGNTLLNALGDLNEKLAKAPLTFAQSLQVLRNQLTSSVKQLDDSFGITSGLAEVTKSLTIAVGSLTNNIINFYENNKELINSLLSVTRTILSIVVAKKALGAIVALSNKLFIAASSALSVMRTSALGLMVAINGVTTSARALRAALISTGFGALAVAIGVLADKFLFAEDATKGFTDEAIRAAKIAEINDKIAVSQERVNNLLSKSKTLQGGLSLEQARLNKLLQERADLEKKVSEEQSFRTLEAQTDTSDAFKEISELDKQYKEFGKTKQELLIMRAEEVKADKLAAQAKLEEIALVGVLNQADQKRVEGLRTAVEVFGQLEEALIRNSKLNSEIGNSYKSLSENLSKSNRELKLRASGMSEVNIQEQLFLDSVTKFSPAQQKRLKAIYDENKALERKNSIRDKTIALLVQEAEVSEDVFTARNKLPEVLEQQINAQKQLADQAEENIRKVQEEIDTVGMSSKQIREYALNKLRLKLANAQNLKLLPKETQELERQILAMEKLNGLTTELEKAKALDDFAEGFADAFFDGVDSGIDYLKDQLKREAFKIFLQPVLKDIGSQIGGFFGIGQGGGVGGLSGLLSNSGALSSLATGGLSGLGLNSVLSNAGGIFSGAYDVAKFLGASTANAASVAGSLASIASKVAPFAGSLISLVQGNVKGAAGSAIGTYLGGFAGPIGAAIGGFLGGKLFGGSNKVSASILDAGFLSSQQQGLSSRYSDIVSSLGGTAAATNFFFGGNTGRQGQNPNFHLGVDVNGQRRFTTAESRVGATGENGTFLTSEIALNAENIALFSSRAIVTALQSSDFADNIDAVFDSIDVRSASLEEITKALADVSLLKQVNDGVFSLTNGLSQLKGASLDVVDAFFNAVGGLEGLQERLGFFYAEFTSEEEQFSRLSDNLSNALRSVGGSLFATRDQFRAFFENLDPQRFGIVSGLLQDIDAYYDVIEGRAQEVAEAEKKAHEETLKQLERIRQAGFSISDYLRKLGITEQTLSPTQRLNAAQSEFDRLVGLSRGGDEDALGKVTQASDALLDAARGFYGSASPFQSIFQSVQEQLKSLVFLTTGERFATGGAFDGGVVSRPTAFNSSLMGEAGPEAILPLTNIGGSLGVRAVGSDNSEVVAELRALRQEMRDLEMGTIEIVTESGETIMKKTLKQIKEGSRRGDKFIYKAGVI